MEKLATLYLASLLLAMAMSPLPPSAAVTPVPGTIQRVTKQQIVASIPPTPYSTSTVLTSPGVAHVFVTSPSGEYHALLIRTQTAIGAGGFGSDFCYMQIEHGGQSVWESECTPVSTSNACSLVFSDAGLEIYDGSMSAWDTGAEGNHIETLVLLDDGNMQIRDKDGELNWKASDDIRNNQHCGSVGAPGQVSAHPPFATPISSGLPFGQQPLHPQPAGGAAVPLTQEEPLAPPQEPLTPHEPEPLAPQPEPLASQQPLQPVAPQQPLTTQEALPQQGPLTQQQPLHPQPLINQQPFSFSGTAQQPPFSTSQPLVDNTPFDSGAEIGSASTVVLMILGVVAMAVI
ncbi:hypothetical protein AMTRI_Chr09g41380 [Amborella trichopoda]|uniref:Bulb-type lectin domain-containing protein n=1 Tax=Amborella trichopoda TaxID=13333 RepID=W1PZD2_AMBTC|nr:uncharacterized protein LOC18441661 [Amborella trichopoda]ERN13416.1 hypothetical protein AMTR_s00041p00183600 [Amborella trichopoda]|eukprot:XP_006851949.1 uncharacterized protein LOC18441661 [Amborella trichopoda]